jgi:hypothetical protein
VGVPSAGLHAVPMAAVNIAQPALSYRMKPLNDGMNSGAGHAQVFRSGVMQKRRIVVGREGCNGMILVFVILARCAASGGSDCARGRLSTVGAGCGKLGKSFSDWLRAATLCAHRVCGLCSGLQSMLRRRYIVLSDDVRARSSNFARHDLGQGLRCQAVQRLRAQAAPCEWAMMSTRYRSWRGECRQWPANLRKLAASSRTFS